MTITAKYQGKCIKCGQDINPGDQINWEKGRGSYHIECPERRKQELPENAFRVGRGQGYGGHDYRVGETFRDRKHGLVTVLSSSKTYYREDGMSFGVGDESGYVFSAVVRPATDDESAPILEQEEEIRRKNTAKVRLQQIADDIRTNGDRPSDAQPTGDRYMDTQDIYGGGSWFVVGADYIWYVRNNGMDGDNWGDNNVGTGGAGAIGYRVAFDATLATEIRDIEAILMPAVAASRADAAKCSSREDQVAQLSARLIAQVDVDPEMFSGADAVIPDNIPMALWVQRDGDQTPVLGCSMDRSVVYLRLPSPHGREYGGFTEDLRDAGFTDGENTSKYYLQFASTPERLALIEHLIPEWVGTTASGRYDAGDSPLSRYVADNAADILQACACWFSPCNRIRVTPDVHPVHEDKNILVWSDGVVQSLDSLGRRYWRADDRWPINNRFIESGFPVPPSAEENPALYTDDITLLIKTGACQNADPDYRRWLLSMRKIGGDTQLQEILRRTIATFEDGHKEIVTIADIAEVPVDDKAPVEVVYERRGNGYHARVIRNTVQFDDGHTEYVYLVERNWWCSGVDADAGTEYELTTDRKTAVESARDWVKE